METRRFGPLERDTAHRLALNRSHACRNTAAMRCRREHDEERTTAPPRRRGARPRSRPRRNGTWPAWDATVALPATPSGAYAEAGHRRYRARELTRGPWDPGHQHGGPPMALACRAIERARAHGLTHLSRLTANLAAA